MVRSWPRWPRCSPSGYLAVQDRALSWMLVITLSFLAQSHSQRLLWQHPGQCRLIGTLLGQGISLPGYLRAAGSVWNLASFWLHFLNVLTSLWAKPNRFTMLCLESIPLRVQLGKQNFSRPQRGPARPYMTKKQALWDLVESWWEMFSFLWGWCVCLSVMCFSDHFFN